MDRDVLTRAKKDAGFRIKAFLASEEERRKAEAEKAAKKADARFHETEYVDDTQEPGGNQKRTRFTPFAKSTIPSAVPSYVQLAAEERFFEMDGDEFEALIGCASGSGIISRLRNKNLRFYKYDPDAEKKAAALFLNYWPILLFAVPASAIAVFFSFGMTTWYLPCLGLAFAAIDLWLLRWARIKKALGLKLFCPFSIAFLAACFVYSGDLTPRDRSSN